MSASLVGSEMCIRDSPGPLAALGAVGAGGHGRGMGAGGFQAGARLHCPQTDGAIRRSVGVARACRLELPLGQGFFCLPTGPGARWPRL
eukprot:10036201-Alexandrium_andersonii.AAC.1